MLLFPFTGVLAQDTLTTDSSAVELRIADQQTLRQITDEDVFDYNQEAQNPESLWWRFIRWLIQLIEFIFDNKWAALFFKITFYALFAFALIGLINQVLGGNMTSAFSGKQAQKKLDIQAGETEISQNNLDQLLSEAVSQGRFSDAVRFLYLKSLKELSERGLIELKHDKTNHDYLNELGTHPASTLFSRLTLFYEYVEYGDFGIEEKGFSKIRKVYSEFKSKIPES